MKRAPDIIIQIIHIEGPLKGEVQEFSESEITFGRNPSCHVAFPMDQMIISRLHAKIVRDGNRFKIIDQSSNGTLVNGKPVSEQFIKDGDVIFITEQGPKFSFLTRQPESGEKFETAQRSSPEISIEKTPQNISKPQIPEKEDIAVQEMAVQLVIQYGPNLHSFKKLPVTVGQSPDVDLKLSHASISGRHAQFFYHEGQYWIKDLTGQNLIRINEIPIGTQQQMSMDDQVSLGPDGPLFKFIGEGRLIEVEKSVQIPGNGDPAFITATEKDKAGQTTKKEKKRINIFKAFFK
ncbi:MAG: FHA domain-containing protein [Proteobacteria bacterium]|nr:FHA domain-containing protein [Pseudomonadota bacterium]